MMVECIYFVDVEHERNYLWLLKKYGSEQDKNPK